MKQVLVAVMVAACGSMCRAEEPKLELIDRAGHSVFQFRSEVKLDDGARVDLKLYYVRRYKIPPGLVGPGEPDFEEELIDVDKDEEKADGGVVTAEMGASDLPVWPGNYRVVASWPDAKATDDDGRTKVTANAAIGETKDLPGMRALADREVYEDMAKIGRVLTDLRGRWATLRDVPDPGWADFIAESDRRINAVKVRNGKRRSAEFYWMECRGKQRIDWTLQKVCPLLKTAALYFTRPVAERADPKDLDLAIAETEDDYQHYLDFMGIGRIVDADKVDSALAKVRGVADDIKGWRPKAAENKAGWAEASIDLGTRLMDSAMSLSGELPEAFFARAESVQKAVLAMLAHVRSMADGLKPAVEWDELEKKLEGAVKELKESVPRISED